MKDEGGKAEQDEGQELRDGIKARTVSGQLDLTLEFYLGFYSRPLLQPILILSSHNSTMEACVVAHPLCSEPTQAAGGGGCGGEGTF